MLRPHAVVVKPREDYCLFIEFSNGEKRVFDVKPYLQGEWFSELKRPEVFGQVKVEGMSIVWPGGQDICPDELYYGSRCL